jgi:hypothetical protein
MAHFENCAKVHIFFNNSSAIQGPLITDGRNSSKWTGPLVVLAKTLKMAEMSKQNV